MKPNIVTCHGFKDGEVHDLLDPMVKKLRAYNYNVQEGDYGYFHFHDVLHHNDSIARVLAGMVNKGSVLIGHSNGCAIAYRALEHTDSIDTLVLVNPALDSTLEFPDNVERVLVYRNKFDFAVEAADLIPFHIWGDMGREGYLGDDPRVTNYETHELFGVKGHSDVLARATNLLFEHLRLKGVI